MADFLDWAGLGLNALGLMQASDAADEANQLNYQSQQDKLALQKKLLETPTYDVYGGRSGYLPDATTGEMGFRTQLSPAQQAIADAILRTQGTQAGLNESRATAAAGQLPTELKGLNYSLEDAQGIVDRDLQRYEAATISPLLKQIQSQIQRQGGDMYSNTPTRYAEAFSQKVLPAVQYNREQKALDLQDVMKKRAQQNVNYLATGETPTYTNLTNTTGQSAAGTASGFTTPTTTADSSGLLLGTLGSNLQALSSADKAEQQSNKYFDSFNRWLGNQGK